MKRRIFIILALIIISVIISLFFYPKMPEQMASHWNSQGNVNGYMPKFLGLFIMPIISVFMLLLFMIIPRLDPLKKNIEKFRNYFDGFIIFLMLFLLYIHVLVIIWNLGYFFNMALAMLPAMGILFYYCGILIGKAKMNWFIGIRTPWTMSNEKVWSKTHKLGSKLFKTSGAISLLSMLIPKYSFWIMVASIIIAAIWSVLYSYIIFKKLEKQKLR